MEPGGRRRNEIWDNMLASGGADSTPYTLDITEQRTSKRLPASFNRIPQHMLELVYKLNRLVREEIPRAFPYKEPSVRQDPRYKHDEAESLYATPVTKLDDVNAALAVCSRLKELLTSAKMIITSFYPKKIDSPTFTTEVNDQFQAAVQVINENIETIEAVRDVLVRRRGSNLVESIDWEGLEQLKNHIIKKGYEAMTGGGTHITTLFPQVLSMRPSQDSHPPAVLPRGRGAELHNSRLEDKLSERLINDFKRRETR